jgi:hypothetical protein
MIQFLGNYGRLPKKPSQIVSIWEGQSLYDSNYRFVSFISSRSVTIFLAGRYIHVGAAPSQPVGSDTLTVRSSRAAQRGRTACRREDTVV